MANHDGTIIARFIGVIGFEDGVDNVQGPWGGEAITNDGVKETRENGGRVELACLRYLASRFLISGAFP